MQILQVNSADEIGGGEIHVLQLTAALRSRGHDVTVAGRRGSPLNAAVTLPFLNSADLFTAYRLRAILKREGFDIVHAHLARDYPIVAAAALGIAQVRIVFTRHLLYSVRHHFLYERVDGWIAPTHAIRNSIAALKPKKAAVIPNWVDLDRFRYSPHPFHQPVTIGLVGQISPHKGHADAVEAMRLLGRGFRLIIAGKGEPSYEADLRRSAADLPVEFAGFVAIPEFFQNIDILIVPSWEEPFGIIVLEAMASGIPVVATNRGGPAEIAKGILIPPRDPAALAAALRSVKEGDYIAEARAHVEKNFDIRRVVPMIEDFYATVSRAR
jgi:glycosyltransferase involved in cell wall biosynthesis